jgi:peroxiredoxin
MIGQLVPDVLFRCRVRDDTIEGPNPYRWQTIRSMDLFVGKRAAVFSLPGAFTPVCSSEQCPAYERMYAELIDAGLDEVYCISVNDAFVMFQWAKQLNIRHVKLIPDGSGHFTRRMGMLVNKEHLGFGYRSWRYSMIVDDCIIEQWFPEPGINDSGEDSDPYSVSAPEHMLEYLANPRAALASSSREAVTIPQARTTLL